MLSVFVDVHVGVRVIFRVCVTVLLSLLVFVFMLSTIFIIMDNNPLRGEFITAKVQD